LARPVYNTRQYLTHLFHCVARVVADGR